ncbi:hypothetical protein HBI56_016410 [Parastagonospora nodorum]|uniref:Uncharacterized protein n=2 Tax=Phaeosphaeria nodorum (strain SN15 / ATCC MYA-4574 / FGSC 10173) TaxID=321614 RepID=A0A7U2HYM5_PHANO|nr:hypothetical protein HBH56_083580 [Parastagonospora nodorum]QRC96750.1 hypothetical protein JI435_016380 [Parastagonospora nodorum SN15]KAH3929848.1 hypothetical protein HBH54_118240 [Parastagonospora nodorum]KAH3955734.1 hypothetical protein HBH53_006310 [Parastagonospora nodorum]KAH3976958.1 hypothetical protein HBH51_075190 [Parastagonospora nodorum]
MNSTTASESPLSDDTPPSKMLPDTLIGYIDVATLQDIHLYLNQSALDDDLALATWIKEHFLYEPITSPGREIRTTLGFFQLNRAYRRVRSLTNKAQDKWPFFSRAWKELSIAQVRNNARGEAAPGVPLTGMSNAMHGSPMSNEQHGQTSECPSDTVTAEALSQPGSLQDAVQKSIEDDLEAGKVRGRNGRFMPKEDPVRSTRGSKAKPARKLQVTKMETPDGESVKATSPAPLTIEGETMVAAPLTPASMTPPSPTFKLAAESEAVWTTLDRLPPGSWLAKKRKREAQAEEGSARKRARPSLSRTGKAEGQEGEVTLTLPERT